MKRRKAWAGLLLGGTLVAGAIVSFELPSTAETGKIPAEEADLWNGRPPSAETGRRDPFRSLRAGGREPRSPGERLRIADLKVTGIHLTSIGPVARARALRGSPATLVLRCRDRLADGEVSWIGFLSKDLGGIVFKQRVPAVKSGKPYREVMRYLRNQKLAPTGGSESKAFRALQVIGRESAHPWPALADSEQILRLSLDSGLVLEGVYRTPQGPVAEIRGPNPTTPRGFLLRPGDQLFDGHVASIEPSLEGGGRIVFKQVVMDPDAQKPFQEVEWRLDPGRQ